MLQSGYKRSEQHVTTANAAGTAAHKDLVRSELQRILESPSFRTSKRCQEFLKYVVGQSLEGHDDNLKERTLGVEIFDRPALYDTSGDAIVRVKANEVRKRLAQFYVEAGPPEHVRIDLPPGSYVPEFQWTQLPAAAEAPPAPERKLTTAGAIAAIALIALAAAVYLLFRPHQTEAGQFWAPVLSSRQPVLICSGNPVVYLLSRRVHERFRAANPQFPPGLHIVQLPPNETVAGEDIIPAIDQYVGRGDAHTAAYLMALFARLGKPSQLRVGNDTSFHDLRNSPSILIGYSNAWTLEMTRDLRYVFSMENGAKLLRDRSDPKRSWRLPGLGRDGKTSEDYAILSRVFEPATGQVFISAAGITQYGTQAAGELLADELRLSQALVKAAPGWQTKNLQILMHARVVGRTATPATPLEVHVW